MCRGRNCSVAHGTAVRSTRQVEEAVVSRTARFVGALVLSVALVPVVAVGPAAAATSTEPASVGAYYYRGGLDAPEGAPAPPPNAPAQGDYVAPEHLAVAVTAPNQADKISFVAFDLVEVPLDGTISKAVLRLPLAEDGNGDPRQNRSVSPDPARVQACPAGDEGFASEDGANISGAPSDRCDTVKVVAKASADRASYEFDVTAIAQGWLTGENNGLALVPAVLSTPFQVVFKPFAEATLTVDYTAPAEEPVEAGAGAGDSTTGSAVAAGEDTATGSGDSGSADVGGFDAGTGAGTVDTAPLDAGGAQVAIAEPPAVPEAPPAPETADAPVAQDGGSAVVQPVAATAGEAPLNPTLGFWLALVVLGGVLTLLSLILGDPTTPAATTATPSRLTRALQAQASSGRSLLARPAAPTV
ncbi:MAG: hypothetical protein JWN57_983 [Frankiales bacterium]|nr:hypothetical protein [Frankiales bacterium]